MNCEDLDRRAAEYAALNDRQTSRIAELEQELSDLKAYNLTRTDEMIAATRQLIKNNELIGKLKSEIAAAERQHKLCYACGDLLEQKEFEA